MNSIDQRAIDTLRLLSIEAISKAKSGHPGIALGAAPIIHTLFSRIITTNPKQPNWINRDRFVMAAGHGSALLYTMLHLSGYDVSIDDLQAFRSLNSITPGHPESHLTPGVDASSGPLGQGFATSVGMAIAEAHLGSKHQDAISHYTYVICGDGDLQEGITQEAASLAGMQSLNKLIVLFDSNDIQLDGPVHLANTENIANKFQAMRWDYQIVVDGNDIDAIEKAVLHAQTTQTPSLIEIKTIIGYGASNQGTSSVHGAPLKDEEVIQMRQAYGGNAFEVDSMVYEFYRETTLKRGLNAYNLWVKSEGVEKFLHKVKDVSIDFANQITHFPKTYAAATRVSSGIILKELANLDVRFIGGSADLSSSTNIGGADGIFSSKNRTGRHIKFGVREHAMAAIANGIALHQGLFAYCSGFFVFADYMKPAMRLSAIMELPVLYIFTHDSIAVGEDGPTHQPIEQLSMLRSIPNMCVIRPADANEVKAAYQLAIKEKSKPIVLVLTRQSVPTVVDFNHAMIEKGGYIIDDAEDFEGILIASGSEVSLALEAKRLLLQLGKQIRVVSMPSIDLFEAQPQAYQDMVLPPHITKRMTIELSDGAHMQKFVGLFGKGYHISKFGKSAPGKDVLVDYKFTAKDIVDAYLLLPNVKVQIL